MLWVAVTGGIACGKSAFASVLRRKGYVTIDTDQIAREKTGPGSPLLENLILKLGESILDEKGQLARARLFNRLFMEAEFKEKLESLMHPIICKEMKNYKEKFLKQGKDFAFCEVPLLYEKGLERDFDSVLVLSSPLHLQRERLEARLKKAWLNLNISAREQRNKIDSILSQGIPLKVKKTKANYVIENEGTLSDLEEKVDFLLKELKKGKIQNTKYKI